MTDLSLSPGKRLMHVQSRDGLGVQRRLVAADGRGAWKHGKHSSSSASSGISSSETLSVPSLLQLSSNWVSCTSLKSLLVHVLASCGSSKYFLVLLCCICFLSVGVFGSSCMLSLFNINNNHTIFANANWINSLQEIWANAHEMRESL